MFGTCGRKTHPLPPPHSNSCTCGDLWRLPYSFSSQPRTARAFSPLQKMSSAFFPPSGGCRSGASLLTRVRAPKPLGSSFSRTVPQALLRQCQHHGQEEALEFGLAPVEAPSRETSGDPSEDLSGAGDVLLASYRSSFHSVRHPCHAQNERHCPA